MIRDKKEKKSTTAIKVVAVIAVLGIFSLGLAYGWQLRQNEVLTPPETQSADMQPPQNTAPAEEPDPEEAESSDMPAESSQSGGETDDPGEEGGEEDGEEPVAPGNRPAAAATAVPESARVSNSYFDDAIFFGDSISTGIPIYQVAGNPDTVAFAGINPDSINHKEVIVTEDGAKTMLDAAKAYGPKNKVYIMLGSNGLWMDPSTFTKGYQTFIDSVKEQYPEAVIYLQSIPPVTTTVREKYDVPDNGAIREFNLLVQELAQRNGLYYLDVAQALMDDEGNLPQEASPGDGMHLTPEYYNKWFDYLKTHTVEEKQQ